MKRCCLGHFVASSRSPACIKRAAGSMHRLVRALLVVGVANGLVVSAPASVARPPLRLPALAMLQQSKEPLLADEYEGRVMRTSASLSGPNPYTQGESIETNVDRLMEIVTGGSGTYSAIFTAVLIISLHAVLAFGTLSGVLLDASIADDLGLSIDQLALGNSLVFFGWIPGSIVGGPLGDRYGRLPALLGFGALGGLGLCAAGLVPAGAGSLPLLLAARAVTGVGLGGFVAPSFTLLVESSDPRRRGQASVSWTWGYVGGVVLLCALHASLSAGLHCGWRAEELTLGAWTFASALACKALIVESPKYLLASGAPRHIHIHMHAYTPSTCCWRAVRRGIYIYICMHIPQVPAAGERCAEARQRTARTRYARDMLGCGRVRSGRGGQGVARLGSCFALGSPCFALGSPCFALGSPCFALGSPCFALGSPCFALVLCRGDGGGGPLIHVHMYMHMHMHVHMHIHMQGRRWRRSRRPGRWPVGMASRRSSRRP